MKQNRLDAVLRNMEEMGLTQVLITDPLSIFYLTGRMIRPLERFYALYLNRSGGHKIFINQFYASKKKNRLEIIKSIFTFFILFTFTVL